MTNAQYSLAGVVCNYDTSKIVEGLILDNEANEALLEDGQIIPLGRLDQDGNKWQYYPHPKGPLSNKWLKLKAKHFDKKPESQSEGDRLMNFFGGKVDP